MDISRKSLHVIPDDSHSIYNLEEITKYVLEGGADVIQLRHKTLSSSDLLTVAQRLRNITSQYSVPFIVNDRVDIAMVVGADGVHLGQDDLPVKEVRSLMGKQTIIGVSCGSVKEAIEAQEEGANYIGFGHMYPTSSKIKLTPQRTLDELQQVADAVGIPVIAIGGITEDKVAELLQAGAAGVAVIGAVCRSEDPKAITMEFRKVIDTVLLRFLERDNK